MENARLRLTIRGAGGWTENPRLRPGSFDQAPRKDASLIRRYAAGSASIDWDQPSAFSLEDPWCRAWKHPEFVGRRRPLASVPMALDRPVFECVLASKKAKVKQDEGKRGSVLASPSG